MSRGERPRSGVALQRPDPEGVGRSLNAGARTALPRQPHHSRRVRHISDAGGALNFISRSLREARSCSSVEIDAKARTSSPSASERP